MNKKAETTPKKTDSKVKEISKKDVGLKKKKKIKRNITSGIAYVYSTFNNTIISIADENGNVIAWSSAGAKGFKGSRKSTPYAAQIAADDAGLKAYEQGLISEEEINKLQDPEYSKRIFNANYEVLIFKTKSPKDHKQRVRYYTKELFCDDFLLTSQWYEPQWDNLLTWLKQIGFKQTL